MTTGNDDAVDQPKREAPERPRRSTVGIDPERHALMRAAVRLVRRESNDNYTATRFIAEAVDAQIRQLERDYNNGKPLEPDLEPLPPGRIL